MSKNRDDATLRVYAALEQYERALDIAAKQGALLAAELPQARLDGNFALEVAQGAFTHFFNSLSTMSSIQYMVSSHSSSTIPSFATNSCRDRARHAAR